MSVGTVTDNTCCYLVIPGWEKFQHYTERWPPWIKNYTALLANDAYLNLTGHRRAILHGLWLAYSMSHGEVRLDTGSTPARHRLDTPSTPARHRLDTGSITRRLNLRVTISDLEALNHAGFIAFSASRPLASHAHAERREEEKREEKRRTTPTAAPSAPHQRDPVWDFVTEIEGDPLPRYRAARGRIVADLRDLLADMPPDLQPGELRRRHGALAREWGDAKATARALVQHWNRAGRIADGTYTNGRNRPGLSTSNIIDISRKLEAKGL